VDKCCILIGGGQWREELKIVHMQIVLKVHVFGFCAHYLGILYSLTIIWPKFVVCSGICCTE
jgi:hypothetical protein